MISKILVPVDGSETAQKAVSYAVDLAKQLNASVFILSVIDSRLFVLKTMPLSMLQTMPASGTMNHVMEPIEDYLHQAAEKYVEEVKNLCEKNGVHPEIVITAGHPVEEIVKQAEKLKTNLIIMGSHGRSALEATVIGSVTYGVIHNKDLKIPVMIVKG